MKYLMFYTMAAGGMAQAPLHIAAHRERLSQFHADGSLLMAGPVGTPPTGALGVFTSREAAESFVAGDPFVLQGVVDTHRIEPWSEVLAP